MGSYQKIFYSSLRNELIMTIGVILFLIIGIFLIIFSILIINHYRLHPEKEGAALAFGTPFSIGILFIISAITDYGAFILLSLIIFGIIFSIYNKYNPKHKKRRERNDEILFKKYPSFKLISKLWKITSYLLLVMATFLLIFVFVVVYFNIRF